MDQKLSNLANKFQVLLHSFDRKAAQFILFVRLNKVQGITVIFALAMTFILLLVFAIMQEWLIILNITLFFVNCFLFAAAGLFITYFICKKLHKKIPMFKKLEEFLFYKALTQEINEETENKSGEDWELIERMKKTNAEWQEKYKSIIKHKEEEPKIKM